MFGRQEDKPKKKAEQPEKRMERVQCQESKWTGGFQKCCIKDKDEYDKATRLGNQEVSEYSQENSFSAVMGCGSDYKG